MSLVLDTGALIALERSERQMWVRLNVAQLGAAGVSDVVDAAVILLSRDGDEIVTSDHADLEGLVTASGRHIELIYP